MGIRKSLFLLSKTRAIFFLEKKLERYLLEIMVTSPTNDRHCRLEVRRNPSRRDTLPQQLQQLPHLQQHQRRKSTRKEGAPRISVTVRTKLDSKGHFVKGPAVFTFRCSTVAPSAITRSNNFRLRGSCQPKLSHDVLVYPLTC